MHDYFCNYTDLVVRTGGKQLVVNQDRNILKAWVATGNQTQGLRP